MHIIKKIYIFLICKKIHIINRSYFVKYFLQTSPIFLVLPLFFPKKKKLVDFLEHKPIANCRQNSKLSSLDIRD
jgi:hypothetical protein